MLGIVDGRGVQLGFSRDSSSEALLDGETGEKTGGGSACSESGRLFDLPLRVAGLCTLRCIVLHVCFSIARCFVRVAFPFNPFAINIATNVVGGIFSGLFALEWCEKSRTIKSLVVQCGGAILTYGATLILLRCLCLYNAFLGPFSLVLSRASFSYLFCLGLTQTTVFMLRRWLCSPEVALAKEVATMERFEETSSSPRVELTEAETSDLINKTKRIEETSLQYLSQIREIRAIHFFILAVLKAMSSSEETAQPSLTSLIADTEKYCDVTKEHYVRITEGMTKCHRARKRIEQPDPGQVELLGSEELTGWKVTLDETISENFQLCPNNQGDKIGLIIEEFIKYILGESQSTLEQLQLIRQNTDPESKGKAIQLLLKLAGWCEQFCGTCEFMETVALSDEDKRKAEHFMQSIQKCKKSLEEVYQRTELSYIPSTTGKHSLTKQRQILSEGVANFPGTQQEHKVLLESLLNQFSLLKDMFLSSDLPSSKGKDYMAFQAKRMHERIQQHIRQISS